MDKRTRELTKLARRYGLRTQKLRNGHVGFITDGGAVVAVSAWSPSCPRGQKNFEKELERRMA